MMNRNSLFAIVIGVALVAVGAFILMDGSGIKPIYHTQQEWADLFKVPEYGENKEITGDYDISLAAECENGTFVGLREDNGTVSWKGIPFGKIPARFERSVDPDPSDKVYEAYYFGKSFMQPTGNKDEMASQYMQGDLDCLTLAVYAGNSDVKDKPVLVYIHGGGWIYGGTSDHLYNGSNFVYYNPDMIVVDITYRVGLLGQINLGVMVDGEYLFPDYEGNEDVFSTSVNNGILDQIQALRWIKANISAFGGDPDNVTICGESAGGGSVSILVMMASDSDNEYIGIEEGLFGKAISMSGGFNQMIPMEKTEVLTKRIVEDLGVRSIKELQDKGFEELSQWWNAGNNQLNVNYCVLDGDVVPLDPYATWNGCVGSDMILMSGATTNEFAYYRSVFKNILEGYDLTFEQMCTTVHNICTGPTLIYPDFVPSDEFVAAHEAYMESLGNLTDIQKILEFVNDYSLQGINYYMAEKCANNGGTCYTYAFDQPYDGKYSSMKAAHAVDCAYLFGNFDGNLNAGTNEQVDFSIQFMRMIAQFCRTGDPSVDGHQWKAYDAEDRNCMFLRAGETKLIPGFNSDRIGSLVEMFDTNPHFRFVESWTNLFIEANHEVHGE